MAISNLNMMLGSSPIVLCINGKLFSNPKFKKLIPVTLLRKDLHELETFLELTGSLIEPSEIFSRTFLSFSCFV